MVFFVVCFLFLCLVLIFFLVGLALLEPSPLQCCYWAFTVMFGQTFLVWFCYLVLSYFGTDIVIEVFIGRFRSFGVVVVWTFVMYFLELVGALGLELVALCSLRDWSLEKDTVVVEFFFINSRKWYNFFFY